MTLMSSTFVTVLPGTQLLCLPLPYFMTLIWALLCKYPGVVDQLFSFMSFLKLHWVVVPPESTVAFKSPQWGVI